MKSLVQHIDESSNVVCKRIDATNFIDACLSSSEDTYTNLSMHDVINTINEEVYDEEDYLTPSITNKLFRGFEKNTFCGMTLSNNGYEGSNEAAYDELFKNYNGDYGDCNELEAIDWSGNSCSGCINRIIDKNGNLIIISDMDPCLIFVSYK